MWMAIFFAIEAMALAGTLGVAATGRTQTAFVAGFNTMLIVSAIYIFPAGLGARAALIFAMVVIYLARMNWVLLAWRAQTAVSKIDATASGFQKYFLSFVLANSVGWGYCLPFYFAARRTESVNWVDGMSCCIYVAGTVVHFLSDYQKRRFKQQPDSKDRILDTGLWSASRHPNYFGDFLIYVSFAVISGRVWGWAAPMLNLAQYVFDAIPKNESWAAQRYGGAWDDYRKRTKAFLPYIV